MEKKINMEKKASLEKMSKTELIDLILEQFSYKPMRPIPTPRKSVKSIVQQYEVNISSPPTHFKDDFKPIPAPRTQKSLDAYIPSKPSQPIPAPRTQKSLDAYIPSKPSQPIPAPRTQKSLDAYIPSKPSQPIPAPRTQKSLDAYIPSKPSQPIPAPDVSKTIPEKRTIITQIQIISPNHLILN